MSSRYQTQLNPFAQGLLTGQMMGDAAHEFDVNSRIDAILKASNGGQQDLQTIDPRLYSDRVGMEAMGKVSTQLAQTGANQIKMFQNGLQNADNLWTMAKSYEEQFNQAVQNGDHQRALGLLGGMVNRFGLPYRYAPDGKGGFQVTHITPEGEKDMGSVSLSDAYHQVQQYLQNKDTFVNASMAFNTANLQRNRNNMADPSKWKMLTLRDGRQVAAVPQTFTRNGQMVAGYFVEGMGNMTMGEVAQLLPVGKAGGGLGMGGSGGGSGRGRGRGRRGNAGGGGNGSLQGTGGTTMTPAEARTVSNAMIKLAGGHVGLGKALFNIYVASGKDPFAAQEALTRAREIAKSHEDYKELWGAAGENKDTQGEILMDIINRAAAPQPTTPAKPATQSPSNGNGQNAQTPKTKTDKKTNAPNPDDKIRASAAEASQKSDTPPGGTAPKKERVTAGGLFSGLWKQFDKNRKRYPPTPEKTK